MNFRGPAEKLSLLAILTAQLFDFLNLLNFPEQLRGALFALKQSRYYISPALLAIMYATIIGPLELICNSGHVTAFSLNHGTQPLPNF